jgi:hypothetical protein
MTNRTFRVLFSQPKGTMKLALLSLIAVIALSVVRVRAADDSALAAVRAADDARVAAILAGDSAKLSAVLSDELRYGHSTGAVDTKASFIESLSSGRLKYIDFKYEERRFNMAGPGVAVMSGQAKVKSMSDKGPSEAVLNFLAVWREEDGHWRFFAWQSCKLTPAPTTTK